MISDLLYVPLGLDLGLKAVIVVMEATPLLREYVPEAAWPSSAPSGSDKCERQIAAPYGIFTDAVRKLRAPSFSRSL
jgi:hypothetical protein